MYLLHVGSVELSTRHIVYPPVPLKQVCLSLLRTSQIAGFQLCPQVQPLVEEDGLEMKFAPDC